MPYKDPKIRREKQKEYCHKYYLKNKDKIVKATRVRRKALQIIFNEYKATLACTKCGENHPATLDFHHHTPHPDNRKISQIIGDGQYALAMVEIKEKCVVLCSNCHRKHHHEERNRP